MRLNDVPFELRLRLRVLWDSLFALFPGKCRHPLYARKAHMRLIEEMVDMYETCTLCGIDLYE